mgnify:CR=1 FL=1
MSRSNPEHHSAHHSSSTPHDLYAEVTNAIIAALEAGTPPWVCPWNKGHGSLIPANVTTGMKIVPVRWIDEVLDIALERPLAPLASAGEPLATRAVMIGTEGPSLPASASTSRVKAGGTDVYWAPGETRAVKAKLAGGTSVSLCEATDDDAWFGIVFAAPGGDPAYCDVTRPVRSAREYQGPCRWGWIKGGTVQLGG